VNFTILEARQIKTCHCIILKWRGRLILNLPFSPLPGMIEIMIKIDSNKGGEMVSCVNAQKAIKFNHLNQFRYSRSAFPDVNQGNIPLNLRDREPLRVHIQQNSV
jgi:hypothetical protein